MWVRVEDSLPSHRKVKKLARLLKTSQPAAIGHIVSLWLWCATNVPDGELADMDDEDIAEAALWPKKAGTFVEALRTVGFLDEDGHLHDWEEYAGKMIETQNRNRKASRERQARYRARQKAMREEGDEETDSDVTEETPSGDGNVIQNSALDNGSVTRYVTGSDGVGYTPYETKRNDTLLSLSISSLSDEERMWMNPIFLLARSLESREPDETQMVQLVMFRREMSVACISRAVEIARREGKGVGYLLGILQKKQEQGVTCLEEWDRAEACWKLRDEEEWTPVYQIKTGLEDDENEKETVCEAVYG